MSLWIRLCNHSFIHIYMYTFTVYAWKAAVIFILGVDADVQDKSFWSDSAQVSMMSCETKVNIAGQQSDTRRHPVGHVARKPCELSCCGYP